MQKKVLVHIISSLQRGGAENLLASLIPALVDYDHHVFYIHDGPVRAEIEALDVPVYPIRGILFWGDPIAILRLARVIRALSPVAILSSLWAANLIARVLGTIMKISVINTMHALREHDGWLRTLIDRLVPVRPTRYVAVSNGVARSLERYGISPARVTIIENGIDRTMFFNAFGDDLPPLALSAVEGCEHFIIGAVGRLVPVKNFGLLIDAFAQLAKSHVHARLMIIGDGPLEAGLKAQVTALGISDLVTFVHGKKATDYYQFFDCFVQPSHTEGLSMALLEAMCSKLPVIVSCRNLAHDVVQHNVTGIIVEPSLEALHTALVKFIIDAAFCERLGASAYNYVAARHSISKTAQDYRSLLSSLS